MSLLNKKEDARIEKLNGEIIGPYKAIFAGDTIIIADGMADIEERDIILRKLPNGKDERSVITKATFFSQGVGSLGAHYQVKFQKGSEQVNHKPIQHINITAAQSVQIGDYNTQNIINSFEGLIKNIENAGASSHEKEEAKSLLKKFLTHPLVISILGAAAGSLIG